MGPVANPATHKTASVAAKLAPLAAKITPVAMRPAIDDLRKRITGCWMGKVIGGTLGMPFEGVEGPLDLDFYRPIPTEMVANDDLDFQVLWTVALNDMEEPRVDSHHLGHILRKHILFPWDEYAWALRNLCCGMHPPLTGKHDNWFVHGMGAAIRSEIWACLAAGNPSLAAAYAHADASIDHDTDGIGAAVFLASLQAHAFVESDPDTLINTGLSFLKPDSALAQAINNARDWWRQHRDLLTVRQLILDHYNNENWTDVKMNVAFTILGWLAGEGDFGKAICAANNCGKDTDCTAATVGAIMGIIDPDCIPPKWIAPSAANLSSTPWSSTSPPPTPSTNSPTWCSMSVNA